MFEIIARPVYKVLKCLLFSLFLFCTISGVAQVNTADGGLEESKVISIRGINSGNFAVGAFSQVTYTLKGENSRKIKNVVTLSVDEALPLYIPSDFSATVGIRIDFGTGTSGFVGFKNETLVVDYKKGEGLKYNPKNYVSFDNFQNIKITITSISLAPSSIPNFDPLTVLVLDNRMISTRYYELAANALPVNIMGTQNTPDELEVSWDFGRNSGNNGSQLEWTWMDNDALQSLGNYTPADLFKNNATRVDLPFNKVQYGIPLLYAGTGTLFYRIRLVTTKASGSRSEGPWSDVQTFSFSGHENSLNWQAATTFAEEGKHKSVMQYFDGSLRNRQTVTKDNVSSTTVSTETLYDLEGRPSIQILPAPGVSGIDNAIKYQPGLNLFKGTNVNLPDQTTTDDPAKYFDLQPVNTVSGITPELKTTTGAARYYSAANPEINSGVNKYLPDAEGFPYTVTRYTPDGTGRIMKQSGVGAAMQMGSGHETRYYYGTPAQEELDGLFGTEAGNYTHYFKNMVRDANGQMSVSYVDMHGRTIATALAGEKPAAMNALDLSQYPNQSTNQITRILLDPNNNVIRGNSIESANTLLVPFPTAYNFEYQLTPQSLVMASCTAGVQLCYSCLYDLEISITDESGEHPPMVRTFNNISLPLTDNCGPAPFLKDGTATYTNNIIQFADTLAEGSYSIRKTLKISEASFQQYKELFAAKAMCKTKQELIDSIYNVLLQVSDCNANPANNTCQSCLNNLGSFAAYRTRYLATMNITGTPSDAVEQEIKALYDQEKAHCEMLCPDKSHKLESIRRMMLADMVPFSGQYAKENSPTPSSQYALYNIFATGNAGQPFYKHPKAASGQNDFYRTGLNTIDGSIHPGLASDNYATLNATTKTGFTQQFNPSWAEALLPYHPEYARLQYAENNLKPSYDWGDNFTQTPTYAQATAFMNASGDPTTVDPFYAFAPASYKTALQSKISSSYISSQSLNLSMWQIAYGDVKCKQITDPANRLNCYISAPVVPPYANLNTAELDQLWRSFKAIYSAERDKDMIALIQASAPLPNAATLISEGYRLNFADYPQTAQQNTAPGTSWYPVTPNTPPSGVNLTPGATTATYATRCSSYISNWKNALLQCPTLANLSNSTQIIDQITAGMVQVCQKGSDAANPYGSSNVAPGTPYDGSPRTFEEVITTVLAANNITLPKNYTCNPYMIEFPKPYGKGPKMYKEITSVVDSCSCTRFSVIRADAYAAGYNAADLHSLNTYLLARFGDTISLTLFNGLQHCGELVQTECHNVDTVIHYPCGTTPPSCAGAPTDTTGYMDCSALTAIITRFYNLHDNTDPANCQTVFTEFFNQTYPGHDWNGIVQLYISICGKAPLVCVPKYDCQKLDGMIQDFNGFSHSSDPAKCHDEFTAFFAQMFGVYYTWNEIVQIFQVNCHKYPPVCIAVISCTDLSNVIDAYYNLYPNLPVNQCRDSFTVYFNNYFGTAYSWPDIVQIYISNCGKEPWICVENYDCNDLTYVVSLFVQSPEAGSSDCKNAFAAFFNNYFGTQYTWNDIEQIYMDNCGFPPDVCLGQTDCTVTCSQQVCHTVYTGSYPLSGPAYLPDFLGCGYVEGANCLSCAQLSAYVAEFKSYFPAPYGNGPVFAGADLTQADIQTNILFARLVNYRTGFQFKWMDYAKAAIAAGCNLAAYQTNGAASQNVICGNAKPLDDTTGIFIKDPSCEKVYHMAEALADIIYQARKDSLLQGFEAAYRAKCLAMQGMESFTVTYLNKEYHYTLYYYDMAGNLVKTVPPKGVVPRFDASFLLSVKAARASNTDVVPNHLLQTNYRYNSLNQVRAQNTPDAHTSLFWYDKLGRLAISQNAEQALHDQYSYTLYDDIGRIKEVGQKLQTVPMTQAISQDATALDNWIVNTGSTRDQITYTIYDEAYQPPVMGIGFTQENLRNRVSYTATKNLSTDADFYTASFYTYDIHGNVSTLLQDYKGIPEMVNSFNRFKTVSYQYDLISGKVNMVSYQPGKADAFYHRYQYDGENRLTGVETSRDQILWETDASYSYYRHGPLARTELGQLQVQGLDYAYTLQGWLKGVNSTSVIDGSKDIGGDGFINGAVVPNVARDIIGFSLHYFDQIVNGNTWQDYKPIGGTSAFARPSAGVNLNSLYNGNIAAMTVNNQGLAKGNASTTNSLPLFYKYQYDQLNRIVQMQTYKGLDALQNQWSSLAAINDYKEVVSYDPNGNILSYNRKGAPETGKPTNMDDLNYGYYYTDINNVRKVYNGSLPLPSDVHRLTNQLAYVHDDAALSGNYTEDIDNQSSNSNYTYDQIGNLIADASENISSIDWSVYGKIRSLVKGGNTISYAYDASGNRIVKQAAGATTFYVRDAQGNVLSVYEQSPQGIFTQSELHLYGGSRLGMVSAQSWPSSVTTYGQITQYVKSYLTRNEKTYELSNHLGNVLAAISDQKLQVPDAGGLLSYYTSSVKTATDYYPFGMAMPGRSYATSGGYRYGFNGKEKENDITQSDYDFGARIYDGRISRWLSLDPLQVKFPSLTPYHFTANNPINFIDPDGKDTIRITTTNIYYPATFALGGIKIGGSYTSSTSSTVIQAPGEDVFFYDITNTTVQINGNPITGTKSRQFFPNTAGKTTGVTSTKMGDLDVPDSDKRSLAKLSPDALVDYLIAKDPAKYSSLKTAKAYLALEAGVNEAHSIVTSIALIADGVAGFFRGGAISDAANFSQTTFNSNFDINGKFNGALVDDIAKALRRGDLCVTDVPVQYIVRDGQQLIVNTRSAAALTKAGISRSKWVGIDVSGQEFFENNITKRLKGNKLTNFGTQTTRQSHTNITIGAKGIQ